MSLNAFSSPQINKSRLNETLNIEMLDLFVHLCIYIFTHFYMYLLILISMYLLNIHVCIRNALFQIPKNYLI